MNVKTRTLNPFKRPRPLYVTCDSGLEQVLAHELKAMGAQNVFPGHRGVGIFGDRQVMWRVNLESRVANRVLLPVAEFPATDRESLYAGAAGVDWTRWFRVNQTLAVDASAHKSELNHTAFMAQVVKDAVCDRFREAVGRRPSVDRNAPDIRINARVDKDRCILSLDTSGERLHRRGYRRSSGDAPIKETLAAGILAISGWQPGTVLIDPMCGSGTFLIEAALMAKNFAPGLLRVDQAGFGFMAWLSHSASQFEGYVETLRERVTDLEPGMIYGADINGSVLEVCGENLARAGLTDEVKTHQVSVADFNVPEEIASGPRHLVSNPPYGERLGHIDRLEATYNQLGDLMKRALPGGWGTLIIGNEAPHGQLGMRPRHKRRLRNGSIQCTLFTFDVFGDGPAQNQD